MESKVTCLENYKMKTLTPILCPSKEEDENDGEKTETMK